MTPAKPLHLAKVALSILCMLGAQNAAAQSARVMVVGDSISAGWEQPSFRMPLVNTLLSESCNIDMVGAQDQTTYQFDNAELYPGKHFLYFDTSYNQSTGAHWAPSLGDDTDHQAFPGIQTDELVNGVGAILPFASYVSAEQPDYILLQTGSSDLEKAAKDGMSSYIEINRWANETIAEIRSLVDGAFSAHQNSTELKILIGNSISNISADFSDIEQDVANQAAQLFARKITAFVETRQDSRLLVVDVASGYDSSQMTNDGLNPNVIGENHIAGAFLTVLRGAGLCADSYPTVTSPSIGSVVNGDSATITWKDNDLGVEKWRVYVGSSQSGNSSDYFDSGSLANTENSILATGLPEDGSNVFITLEYQVAGLTDITLSSVFSMAPIRLTKGTSTAPELFAPLTSEVLEGGSATFRWTENSTEVTQWWLRIGSTAGASDYYSSNRIEDPTQLTEYVSELPTDGEILYVTLYYKTVDGNWDKIQQTYETGAESVTATEPTETALVSPAAGSTLSDTDQTFVWETNESNISQWWFRAGSSIGESDYFDSGRITNASERSALSTNLPTDGSTVHISLYYKIVSGAWQVLRYTYDTESSGSTDSSSEESTNETTEEESTTSSADDATASIVNLVANSVLSGSDQTFTWDTKSSDIRQWWFRVGSSVAGSEFYDSGRITDANQRFVTVSNLPTDGSSLYVGLHFKTSDGSWDEVRYTYTAASTTSTTETETETETETVEVELVSPSANSVLSGSSQSFSWDTDSSSVREWWFRAGSSSGASDYYDSGRISSSSQRSVSATNLPTNGSTVHVRLHFKSSSNVWDSVDSTYTASTSSGSSSSGSSSTDSSSEPPALDLSTVKWLHTDVSGWSESADMSSVTVSSSNVCLNYDKANTWSSQNIYDADLVGNAWVFIWNESESVWYGATWEWLRPGQTCKSASAVNGDHIKQSPYTASSGWEPTSGETLYFMVSGLVRTSVRNVLARTQPVKVIWP